MKNKRADPTISIVIPIYNVEKYLSKCLDSLLSQTFENFEAILVDDGSTDDSYIICKKYENLDGRIKVYHKNNGGLSDARNFGIKHATCDYIVFVDSDDYVDSDYLMCLWKTHIDYNADLVVSGVIRETENGKVSSIVGSEEIRLYSAKEALKESCYGENIPIYAWGKLYTKKSLLKHPYPVGKYHEDVWTTYLLIDEANVIAAVPEKNYHYIQRENSILHSNKFSTKYFDSIEGAIQIKSYVEEKYPELITASLARLLIESNALLHRACRYPSNYIQASRMVDSFLEGNWKIALCDKKNNGKVRAEMLLYKISHKLYRISYLALTK